MFELLAIAIAGGVSFFGYVKTRKFVRERLRFVDGVQKPMAPVVAGSVATLAAKYGYASEVSFRKAFKKHIGKGPGAVRRELALSRSSQAPSKTTLRYGQTHS